MKIKLRKSNHKKAKMTGFRYRMKTASGRRILRRRRARGRSLSAK